MPETPLERTLRTRTRGVREMPRHGGVWLSDRWMGVWMRMTHHGPCKTRSREGTQRFVQDLHQPLCFFQGSTGRMTASGRGCLQGTQAPAVPASPGARDPRGRPRCPPPSVPRSLLGPRYLGQPECMGEIAGTPVSSGTRTRTGELRWVDAVLSSASIVNRRCRSNSPLPVIRPSRMYSSKRLYCTA